MRRVVPRDLRRLAAILSADVVGYSRHMAEDERSTMAALKAARMDLIDPTLVDHGGRIFKSMGDGLLVEFSSVVAAVECAAAIQRGMEERAGPGGMSPTLQLRIGINLGDVIVEPDASGFEDVFGDGVNIAARVQEVADPGGVALSGTVVDHVRNKVGFGFVSLGERRLKNIDDPVPVYMLGPQQHASANERAERVLVRPAVAIMPFRNLSGDPAQEYFADGITEELITALSAWRWFPVIARNSTFTYKGRAVDVAEVGKALGARYVVEGSVQRAGDHVRISAQLLDADTRVNLWAHSYQRHLGDVFELQDEIARAVVGAIEPHLTRAEQQRASRKRPENLDSWDLCLQALAHIRTATPSQRRRSHRCTGCRRTSARTTCRPRIPSAIRPTRRCSPTGCAGQDGRGNCASSDRCRRRRFDR